MTSSDIVAIVSVVTACLSAIVPPSLSFFRWRIESKRDYADVYRSDAIESWLKAASRCIYDFQSIDVVHEVFFAYPRCVYYVSSETGELMKAFCNAALSALSESGHSASERFELYSRAVNALQSEPPRKLPKRRYRYYRKVNSHFD